MNDVYVVKEMNGVLGHHYEVQGYTGLGTTWTKEMKFPMNHAQGAGSIAQPVYLQSRALCCKGNEWCFRPPLCSVRLYWARDNLD